MTNIECDVCHKTINIDEKTYVIENKRYYHKKCYLARAKKENKTKYLPKLKKFTLLFSISLIIFIILIIYQDISNPISVLSLFVMLILTISFGIITTLLLTQLIRFK